MRVNPFHDNTCSIRIGMYREQACYNCPFLSECDQHYDELTGEWDYPQHELPQESRRRKCSPVRILVKKGGAYDTM
jgi:hypothetical protein